MLISTFLLLGGNLLCHLCNGYQKDRQKEKWNTWISGITKNDSEVITYVFEAENDTVARIEMETYQQDTTEASLLAVYKGNNILCGDQVMIEKVSYYVVAKTLCPIDVRQNITVELSSFKPVHYRFRAVSVTKDNFVLRTNVTHYDSILFAQPVFFEYTFEKNVKTVNVLVASNSSDCMTVSVQQKQCPVFDENNNVLYAGFFQTTSKSAAIPVSVEDFGSTFYIVFVMKNDVDCHPPFVNLTGNFITFPKLFSVTVEEAMKESDIWFPILFLVLVFLFIAAVSIGYILFEQEFEKRQWSEFLVAADEMAISDGVIHHNFSDSESLRSYDCLLDMNDREVVRRKTNLKVSDLCVRSWEQRNDKFTKYYMSLITVALFYALPVVQLVLESVDNVHQTGNLDSCWYNYRCARPMTIGSTTLFAFNNILSNCGYIVLGILYLLMTKERDRRYQALVTMDKNVQDIYGLPQHPGISYAIGLAVIMEGVLSASYHVCPTAVTFQFDTAFMFVCALLGMLKIYQLRHPDIIVKAHKTFFVFAFIIFFVTLGVKLNITFHTFNPLWIIYAIAYPLLMFIISIEFYFKGVWRFSLTEIKNSIFYAFVSSRWCSCMLPMFKGRFFFLAFANLMNILFVVYGVIERPTDFASYLLFPFILNLLVYLMYYIVMKFSYGERLSMRVLLFLALSAALWAVSLWYFTNHVSDWSLGPAQSREINKNCIIFRYFDNHDVWHLCSSLAIFISFTLLDRLDDDLRFTKRCHIPVF